MENLPKLLTELRLHTGSISDIAAQLNISRTTIYNVLERNYGSLEIKERVVKAAIAYLKEAKEREKNLNQDVGFFLNEI